MSYKTGNEVNNMSARKYRKERMAHWDRVARSVNRCQKKVNAFYHALLTHYYTFLVPSGLRVLEVGCGKGVLLAAVKPSLGVGIDFSKEAVNQAAQLHPHLHFIVADAHELPLRKQFDIIILSDLINDLWDVQAFFERLRSIVHSRTRLIVNTYSRLWQLPLAIARRIGLAKPILEQSWLTREDVTNLLKLAGFEVFKHLYEILCPFYIPLISNLANRFIVKLWPFSYGALTNLIISRPEIVPQQDMCLDKPKVSVIIPMRNEAGNIDEIFARVPDMGSNTELVFVEGHSTDNTYLTIEQTIPKYQSRDCKLLKQTGKGKGDAVRLGFVNASGDILIILDADLTVAPEDLPRFYQALVSSKGEFINGVRLVYPMENRAMRFLNLVANKSFSILFSWLLGQHIKDTLCGTKAMWKRDYEFIAANRHYFGDFDPFGDFDLIFGASRLNMKIVDLPIRYRQRKYGTTNIHRWQHGLALLKMLIFAAKRIKFV